jgi:tetratricopeptide (TPR) repeat protein
LSQQKKYEEAIKHFAVVLELNPDYLDTQEKMGFVLLAAGRTSEGIVCLTEAIPKSSNKEYIYTDLGTAYLLQADKKMAIQSWKKAIEINPDNVRNLNNLAWLLASRDEVSPEDANEAIKFAQRACELTQNKQPTFLDTLAVAYAAAGKFDDAINTANEAIDTARAAGREDFVSDIQKRLQLYKSGIRYREKTPSD